MTLPLSGWMSESSPDPDAIMPAHYVAPGAEIALADNGFDFVAGCGCKAFPLYAADTPRRVARHPRCADCELLHGAATR